MMDKKWNPPKYTEEEKLPFIPTESEIDALITGSGYKTSTFLQLLKETAIRSGEAVKVSYSDLDIETKTVRITPEKGSRPRIFKLSDKLVNMLLEVKRKNGESEVRFFKSKRNIRRVFERTRKHLTWKLKNERLRRITLHTFRHWKATTLYHQTKDIVYVQRFLGHRIIKNTLKYIQLSEALFQESGNYVCKIAESFEDAVSIIEAGFTKIDEFNGVHLYRKPA